MFQQGRPIGANKNRRGRTTAKRGSAPTFAGGWRAAASDALGNSGREHLARGKGIRHQVKTTANHMGNFLDRGRVALHGGDVPQEGRHQDSAQRAQGKGGRWGQSGKRPKRGVDQTNDKRVGLTLGGRRRAYLWFDSRTVVRRKELPDQQGGNLQRGGSARVPVELGRTLEAAESSASLGGGTSSATKKTNVNKETESSPETGPPLLGDRVDKKKGQEVVQQERARQRQAKRELNTRRGNALR